MNIVMLEDAYIYSDPINSSDRTGKIFKGNIYEYKFKINGWYRLTNNFWLYKYSKGKSIVSETDKPKNEKFEFYKIQKKPDWLNLFADQNDTENPTFTDYVSDIASTVSDTINKAEDTVSGVKDEITTSDLYNDTMDAINSEMENLFGKQSWNDTAGRDAQSLTVKSINNILGMPYQFMPHIDTRIDSQSGNNELSTSLDVVGRKYSEKIAARTPMLLMVAGDPMFMAEVSSEERNSMLSNILENEGAGVAESMTEYFDKPPRYYSFKNSFDQYFMYVDTLCLAAAVNMGLIGNPLTMSGAKYGVTEGGTESSIDGTTNSYLGKENWSEVFTPDPRNSFWAEKGKLESGFTGSVAFYVNSDSQISETISTATTDSMIKSKINQIGDLAREFQFLMGSGSSGTNELIEAVDKAVKGSGDLLADISKNLTGGGSLITTIAGSMSNVIAGGKMIFPQIWQDSQFSREYNINIKLTSPDNDDLSLFHNIIVPLMHLLAFALPRGSSTNSYISPFLVRAAYKSFFKIDMGIITSMSITKGAEGCWNRHGIPTTVDVSFSIKELYGMMNLARMDGIFPSFKDTYDITDNEMLMDYIASLCGLNIVASDIVRATVFRMYMKSFAARNIPKRISDATWATTVNKLKTISNIGIAVSG